MYSVCSYNRDEWALQNCTIFGACDEPVSVSVFNLVDLRVEQTNVDTQHQVDLHPCGSLSCCLPRLHILCGSLTIGCETVSHKALTVKTDPALNNCSDNCSWIGKEMEKRAGIDFMNIFTENTAGLGQSIGIGP